MREKWSKSYQILSKLPYLWSRAKFGKAAELHRSVSSTNSSITGPQNGRCLQKRAQHWIANSKQHVRIRGTCGEKTKTTLGEKCTLRVVRTLIGGRLVLAIRCCAIHARL